MKKIILYGAGCCGAMIAELFAEQGREICCIFDRNEKKTGTVLMGVNVELPHRKEGADRYSIIVCLLKRGRVYSDIRRDLQQLGYSDISHIYDWKDDRELFRNQALIISPDVDKVKRHWQDYEWLKGRLADQESRRTLEAVLEFLLGQEEFGMEPHPLKEQYFAYDVYRRTEEEAVIDCGAFKGEVMDIFMEKNPEYANYMAIEPDREYGKDLERKREKVRKEQGRDSVTVVPLALSDRRETLRMTNYGNEDSIVRETGTEIVEAVTLDELAAEYPCTFLKIDVEGYEKKVLKGAERLIKTRKPVIAVAAYHHEEDFYELCRLIEGMAEGYSFYLRSYMNLQETILYAVPEGRRAEK